MAAKNIKTRNLTDSITKVLDSTISDQSYRAAADREALKRKDMSKDYFKQRIQHDDFVAKVQRQNVRAENNVNVHQKRYDELLADRLTVKGNTATEALLAETRATKTWARIERDLAGKDKQNHIGVIKQRLEAAIKQGDHSTVAAINSEAPHYLRSRGMKDPEQIIELIIRSNDREVNDAHRDIIEAQKLQAITRHNTAEIVKSFEAHINTGLDGRLENTSQVEYYVEPGEAIRSSANETNEALREAMEAARTPVKESTDTSDASDESYNPDALEPTPTAEEPATESRFSSSEPTFAPGFN